jgi:hypothetical protein
VGAGEHGVTPIRTYSEAEARTLGLLEDVVEAEVADAPEPGSRRAGFLDELRRRTVIR